LFPPSTWPGWDTLSAEDLDQLVQGVEAEVGKYCYANAVFDDNLHSARQDVGEANRSLRALRELREVWPALDQPEAKDGGQRPGSANHVREWQQVRRQQEEADNQRRWCIHEACVMTSALRQTFRELAEREVFHLKAYRGLVCLCTQPDRSDRGLSKCESM
jgi:hypothetical protein